MAKETKKEVAAAVEESTAPAVSVDQEAQANQSIETQEQPEPSAEVAQANQSIETEEQQKPIIEEIQVDQTIDTEELQKPSVEEVQIDQLIETEELQKPSVEEVQVDQLIETGDKEITEVQYFGRTYGFTATAPERMQINGQILSKQEILSNPDVVISMIESKNIFITEK